MRESVHNATVCISNSNIQPWHPYLQTLVLGGAGISVDKEMSAVLQREARA